MKLIFLPMIFALLVNAGNVSAQNVTSLLVPAKNAKLDVTNNIIFRWTPVPPRDSSAISYKVQVFDLGKGVLDLIKGSLLSLITGKLPVWETIQKKGTGAPWQVPENAVGKKFVWRVITLVNSQPQNFPEEFGQQFYINSLTIKTDFENRTILADGTIEPQGKPKKPVQSDTFPVKGPLVGNNNYTRPKLDYPQNGMSIKATAIKDFQFIWTAVSPNPKEPVTYNWYLYQKQGNQSANDAVKNGAALMQGSVKGVQNITVNLPQDAPGNSYAWTVRAVNGEGKPYGDNNGFADPFVFSVQKAGKITGPGNPPSPLRIDCNIGIDAAIIECLGKKDNNGNTLYNICLTVNNNSVGGTIFEFNSTANPNKIDLLNIYSTSQTLIKTISGSDFTLSSFPSQLIPGITNLCFQTYLNSGLGSINISLKPYFKAPNAPDKCDNEVSAPLTALGPCPCDLCENINWNESKPKAELGLDKTELKLTQSFNIPGLKIKQIKAEIVSFDWQANEDCKICLKQNYGYFIGGQASGFDPKEAVFPGINGMPLINSSELDWNKCGNLQPQLFNGVLVSTIALPPYTSLSCCEDFFTVCIRYTITTNDCLTCNKVMCYSLIRKHSNDKLSNIGNGENIKN